MAKKKKSGKQLPVPEPEPPFDESTAESTPCSQPTSQRPETSPYTSSLVALRIGPEQREYHVPRDLLQNPDWIASSSTWERGVYLADVDENTGHVLVHYLYTGAYQTLDNTAASPVDEVKIEFKRAVLAYTAAKNYSLHGLQGLAKKQIERFGTEMDIFDVAEALKDDFSKLLGDTAWFHDYLDGKAKAAFEEDRTVFARDGFFGRVNDVGLARVLAKCVVGLYNDKVERMLGAQRGSPVRTSEECGTSVPDLLVDGGLVEEPFTVDAISKEDCPCPALECSVQDYPASDCPAPECPAQDYPADDCSAPECPAQAYPADDCSAPECPAQAYPVNDCPALECPAQAYPTNDCPALECSVQDSPANDYPAPECSAQDYLVDDCPAPECSAQDYLVDDCPALECPAQDYPVQEASTDEPLIAEEQEPVPEHVPEPEPATEEGDLWRWGSFAKRKKGKKAKRGAIEVIEEVFEVKEEPTVTVAPVDGEMVNSELGTCSVDATGEPVAQAEENVTLWPLEPTEGVGELTSNGHSDLKVDSEQPTEAEGEICPLRVKHLLDGDKWKHCRQCRAIVRQVAIQLARAAHTDGDGYEIVDQVLIR